MQTSVLKVGKHRITIRHPDGKVLRVKGNTVSVEPAPISELARFKTELTQQGVAWGDAVKWATDKLGMEQCPSCREAQVVLNKASEIGWGTALKEILRIKLGSR